MTNTFPPLNIVFQSDGLINLIDPTEDGSGNQWAVLVHPAQVRHLAERLGMVASTTADKSVAELLRDADRLKRNLLRVREHALALQIDFAEHADHQHADLSHEMDSINALVGLLDMACDDFADEYCAQPPEPQAQPTPTRPAMPKQLEIPA